MSPVEPSSDASLVVFRVECPDPSDGRLALLGGEGLGNWNPLAARLGVNYPENSTTWYIPVFLELQKDTTYSVKFLIVRLDCNCNIIKKDPVGERVWVLPPGDSAYSIHWGRPEAAALPQEDIPTKETDGVDLQLTAWISHVVGNIKSLHLPSHCHYDFSRSYSSNFKLMKCFVYHPDDYKETEDKWDEGTEQETDSENLAVDAGEVQIEMVSSGETNMSANPPYSSSSSPTVRRIRSVQVAATPLARRASRVLRRGFSSIGKTFTPTRRRANSKSSPFVGINPS